MGDLPKPPDDATWTEVERSFFAAAPPEEPQPVGEAPQRPRRGIIAWLRPSVTGAWRKAMLACAAGLAAALSIGRVDRRRIVFVLVCAIVAAGVTAGDAAFRRGSLTKGATAAAEGPVSGPTIAEATPIVLAASQAAPRPPARVANRRPRSHRRPVAASSSAQRPPVTAFMDRQAYWAAEARSAPVRASRPFFSR